MWEDGDWPHVDQTDERSIAIEALMQLDALPGTWITPDDIPAFIEFLYTLPSETSEGWRKWRQYWEGVDFEKRGRALAGNAYYSPVRIS